MHFRTDLCYPHCCFFYNDRIIENEVWNRSRNLMQNTILYLEVYPPLHLSRALTCLKACPWLLVFWSSLSLLWVRAPDPELKIVKYL